MTADEPVGIRLTVPAELVHASLARACVRDAVSFRSDDHESSFLVALTEVMVNAIEATQGVPADGNRQPVVVELFGPPDARVVVSDSVGHATQNAGKTDHLGAGLSIAEAFVADLDIDTDAGGTRVRLGLGGATP